MFDYFLSFDQPIFQFLNSWVAVSPEIWKVVAIYGVYFVPIVLIYIWFIRRQRDVALAAVLAGIFAWQILNNLVQVIAGVRARPISVVDLHFPTQEFIFDRPGPSFPSDHTAFLIAIALIFWFKGKKNIAGLVALIAVLTMLARVVTAQHWPSDILVGALVGGLAAWLFLHFDGWIQAKIITPLVGFGKKIWL